MTKLPPARQAANRLPHAERHVAAAAATPELRSGFAGLADACGATLGSLLEVQAALVAQHPAAAAAAAAAAQGDGDERAEAASASATSGACPAACAASCASVMLVCLHCARKAHTAWSALRSVPLRPERLCNFASSVLLSSVAPAVCAARVCRGRSAAHRTHPARGPRTRRAAPAPGRQARCGRGWRRRTRAWRPSATPPWTAGTARRCWRPAAAQRAAACARWTRPSARRCAATRGPQPCEPWHAPAARRVRVRSLGGRRGRGLLLAARQKRVTAPTGLQSMQRWLPRPALHNL